MTPCSDDNPQKESSDQVKQKENKPPPVRLPALVADETVLALEPLGTLDTVVAAKGRQVLGRLGVLVLPQVLR